jgi:DNA-binding transcriptional LysR family regulator
MDLWQLHIFCNVVEWKSFSRAGQHVHLSQPTVSSHIKDLEAHFDCRLIDRLGREAVPTKAGEILYRYARKLLAMRDETEAAMADFQGRLQGRLMIGGSTIPGGYLLPRIIGAFSSLYPDVTVSLIIADTENIIQQVLSGELELGVVGARTRKANLVQEAIAIDEMRLVVTSDHPWSGLKRISLEDLQSEPFIVRENGSGTRKSLEEILFSGGYRLSDLRIAAEMGSTVAVIQAIKGGVGVSIVSTTAVRDDLRSGKLTALEIEGYQLTRHLYLTHNRTRTASPLAAAFSAFVKQQVSLSSKQ